MLKLIRQEHILMRNENIIYARGSANIPISLEQDNTYQDYIPQIHCGFSFKNHFKEIILPEEDDHWIVPEEVFVQKGKVYFSVGLVSPDGSEVIKTNQVDYDVYASPRGTVVLPESVIWQKVVNDYVSHIFDQYNDENIKPLIEDIQSAISTANSAIDIANENNKKLDQAYENLGEFMVEDGIIYFKKPDGSYSTEGVSLAGQSSVLIDDIVQKEVVLKTERTENPKNIILVQMVDTEGNIVRVETDPRNIILINDDQEEVTLVDYHKDVSDVMDNIPFWKQGYNFESRNRLSKFKGVSQTSLESED